MDGEVGSDLIECVVNVSGLLHLDWASIVVHKDGGQETDNTSLGSVTLGESLHEVALLFFDIHRTFGTIEGVLLGVSELIYNNVLGEGDSGCLVLLAVTLVPVNNYVILRLIVESSGGGKGERVDEVQEKRVFDVILGLLDIFGSGCSIFTIFDPCQILLEDFVVDLSIDNLAIKEEL